jgi:uncharacterized membrane protein YtjA (UPF0391 family)
MFSWTIVLLIIALIAGALALGAVTGTAFAAAKVIFAVTVLAFVISGVVQVARRGSR